VSISGKEVLKGLSLSINPGETHVLLGQNGTGKSTLALALMGHPNYVVTGGRAYFEGEDLLALPPEERARKGLFLAFQNPVAVPGVSVVNFLRTAVQARRCGTETQAGAFSVIAFQKELTATMKRLGIDPAFALRYLNDGFSGGEKKRIEVLQLAVMRPKLAMLDETDSGLDLDALRAVGEGVTEEARRENMGVLVITHYKRLLDYIKPNFVHFLHEGRIALSRGPELVDELERKGFDGLRAEICS
jgi:Fe-S cluster assembly ATP-binding protein